MLRDYRCGRYVARLKELSRVVSLPVVPEEGAYRALAEAYADRTEPTPGEFFAQVDPYPYLLTDDVAPAPRTIWEEDAALLADLLEHLRVRPTMEMDVQLYCDALERNAGLSVCADDAETARPALPAGKSLGDLVVDFVLPAPDPLVA